ncbi:MAG: NTP transferase domain-containing protein [Leptospiraceae bacterium]|nr:NTP transferase domain-containing protein [Leptospiraceae bacterium]
MTENTSAQRLKGFILAAGFGTRMQSLTRETPKPLLRLGGYPLLYYSLFWMHHWGIQAVTINVHYLADQIIEALENYKLAELYFSREEQILGTAGGLCNCIGKSIGRTDRIVLLNPDTILLCAPADHPDQAVRLDRPNTLFLARRLDDSVTAFSLNAADGRLAFDSAGRFFYIGYSVLSAADLPVWQVGTQLELGGSWRELAAKGRLNGQMLNGSFIDVGTLDAWQKHQDFHFDHPDWSAWLQASGLV